MSKTELQTILGYLNLGLAVAHSVGVSVGHFGSTDFIQLAQSVNAILLNAVTPQAATTVAAVAAGSRCYGGAFTSSDNTGSPAAGNHLVGLQTLVTELNTYPAGASDLYGHVSGFQMASGLWPGAAFRAEAQGANAGQITDILTALPGLSPTIVHSQPTCTSGPCNSMAYTMQGYSTGTTLAAAASMYGGSDGFLHFAAPGGRVILDPNSTATSSTNYGTPYNCYKGSIWNGTAAADDQVCGLLGYGTGANPRVDFTLSHTGSTGLFVWHFPSGTFLQDGGSFTFKDNANNLYAATYVNAPFHTQAEQTKITAASTIAPSSGLFHLAGTTTVNVMTPPTGFTATVGAGNGGTVDFVADAATPFAAGTSVGSIAAAFTTVAGVPYHCVFTPSTGLWYCK